MAPSNAHTTIGVQLKEKVWFGQAVEVLCIKKNENTLAVVSLCISVVCVCCVDVCWFEIPHVFC